MRIRSTRACSELLDFVRGRRANLRRGVGLCPDAGTFQPAANFGAQLERLEP
jgi:hypothetical protein